MRTITLIGLMAAVGTAACGRADARSAPEGEAPIPVRLGAVTTASSARPVLATGVLGAEEEIPLSFKIGGIVSSVTVHEGDAVRAGQVLATIEPAEIDAQLARARTGADKAERDLARVRNLYTDSVATLEQLQNATSAAEVARADLATVQYNRKYATITAPNDGTVLRRTLEVGQLASAGTSVLVVTGRGLGNRLRVGLADRDVVRVRKGDAAVVRFDAFGNEEFTARVSEVGAAAQPQTGTYEVELSIDARGRRLPVGLIGRAEIRPAAGDSVQLVPVEAIAEADGAKGRVYTVTPDNRRARKLDVTIAYIDGDRVALRGGLSGVTRVVTAGAAYLEDGKYVKVLQ